MRIAGGPQLASATAIEALILLAMKTFPIMLDLQGRLAVVVGGGAVGVRKVAALLDAGAQVKLVDQSMSPQARKLESRGVLPIEKPYCAEFLDGASVVFACTDDRALNAQVAQDAHWAGALVNAADQPENCDFFLPAVHSDGDVVVAVGTGGAAPALARQLRDRLAAVLPPRIGEFASAIETLRQEIKQSVPTITRRQEILTALTGPKGYEEFIEGGELALRQMLGRLVQR